MKFERSTERTIIVALAFLIVGFLLLTFGSNVEPKWLSALAVNVGSFIIASVVMAVIFQFWQLRGLIDDLFRQARVAEQIQRAQLSGFSVSFYDNVPWDEMFNESNRLDLMVAYAATWRNTHQARLERFVSRNDSGLEVVLPDPEVTPTLEELARRFNMSPEEVRQRIIDATEFFKRLGTNARGVVRIYYHVRAPQFTFYRFNNRAVFATYRHRPGRGPILTLVSKRGGEFYEWIRDEWYGITRDGCGSGLTRLYYDSRDVAKAPNNQK